MYFNRPTIFLIVGDFHKLCAMCFKTRGSDTFEFFDKNKRNVSIIARVFFLDHLFKGRFLLFQRTFGLFLPCSVVRHVAVRAWILPGFAASHFGYFHALFCHMLGIVRLVYT